jgi:hypothetical protein
MKIRILLPAIFLFAIYSCNNNRTREKPKQETPKAFEDKSSADVLISKRHDDDLVESLYSELVNKNNDLKKLEDKIDDLNKSRKDSTTSFEKFDGKNQDYYNSANTHILQIRDSLLREKMKLLVANRFNSYNTSVARYNELLKIINEKQITIADLHNMVKIVNTLPLLVKYQKDNLPDSNSLKGFIKQQDMTIKMIDTLK